MRWQMELRTLVFWSDAEPKISKIKLIQSQFQVSKKNNNVKT
jgi:hypothetical protein